MITVFSPLQQLHLEGYASNSLVSFEPLELPQRVDSILDAISRNKVGPVIAPQIYGFDVLNRVHTTEMLNFLSTSFEAQSNLAHELTAIVPDSFPPPNQRHLPSNLRGQKGYFCTDTTTPITQHTWEAAISSASCALTALNLVRTGHAFAYALCRPPGHHAGSDFFGGYCYLNNAAIAARAAESEIERIAIVDLDYHHGNGTQAIFYSDPQVWYGSIHVDPNYGYPYFSGYADEIGVGAAVGTNVNIPLNPGTTIQVYLEALDSLLSKLAAFDPKLVIVSMGFDTYVLDPLSTFHITTEAFNQIGRRIGSLAMPTLIVQEGGYYIPDLGLNATALLTGLVD